MNLEYDPDELTVLNQAERVFARLAPVDGRTPRDVGAEVWQRLVRAGWADFGESVERGELSLGLAAGIFRLAGRNLLVDQLVSSAYLLSALLVHIPDIDQRASVRKRLRERAGALLGDGRSTGIPVVGREVRTGYCFGLSKPVDIYRLSGDGANGHVLSVWCGSPPEVEWVPDLSRGVGRVSTDGEDWSDIPLAATRAEVDRIGTNAMLLQSAGLVGLAEKLLEVTCSYVMERVQFGAAIGSNQAVKHELADVFTFTTVAWNAVLSAVAEGASTRTAPAVTRYLAVEATLKAARTAAQFHGGIGFTAELSLHLYLKTALDAVQRFGSHDEYATELGRTFVQALC